MTRLRLFAIAAAASMALALGIAAVPPPTTSVNLSGYEYMLGTSCTIQSQPGKCNVSFGGWTQDNSVTGWTTFPGNGQGLWKASVNYTGSPAFGGHVDVQSGSFDLMFTRGGRISGKVKDGTVMWPSSATADDYGCGAGVAKVYLDLTIRGAGPSSFTGCLHDLPAGSVIPPKIWGTLNY
jgi:hypothetical protein